jgi:hypothetical protein
LEQVRQAVQTAPKLGEQEFDARRIGRLQRIRPSLIRHKRGL